MNVEYKILHCLMAMNASATACMEAAGGMVAAGMQDTSQGKVVGMMEGCIAQVLLLVVMQQDSHSHSSC